MKPLLTLVVGARPNFMKAAALVGPLKAAGLRVRLVHTGQHYDGRMSGVFFRQLGLPRPDRHLGVGAAEPAIQLARILERLDRELAAHPPAMVVVVGDVNSTLAGALAASTRRIPLAHVEAGLRSFDRRMVEERNRVLVDHLADLLFTTAADDDRNLAREGIPAARIRRVGDVMVDTLRRHRGAARKAAPALLKRLGLRRRDYAVVTLHRPENVDDPARLGALLAGLGRASRRLPLLFPVHPRTRRRFAGRRLPSGLRLVEPLGYLEFLGLMDAAAAVLTDSGGIQQETTVLAVPCLTLRDNTERPVTCRLGTNRLVGASPAAIDRALASALSRPPRGRIPPLWDGKAGTRVARGIATWLRSRR